VWSSGKNLVIYVQDLQFNNFGATLHKINFGFGFLLIAKYGHTRMHNNKIAIEFGFLCTAYTPDLLTESV
jgi:hypothetical protein